MNPNGNFQGLTIKPIDLTHKLPVSQNSMNSPKASQPIKLTKPQVGMHQSRSNNRISVQDELKRDAPLRKSRNKTTVEDTKTASNGFTKTLGKTFDLYNQSSSSELLYRAPFSEKNAYNTVNAENISPNALEYEQMHKKLNLLEDRLTLMKEKLTKKRQERKNQTFQETKKIAEIMRREKTKKLEEKQNFDSKASLKQIVSQVNCNKNLKTFAFNPYSPRNHIYYVSEVVRGYRQENSLARDHLITSFQQLKALRKVKGPSKEQLESKQVRLTKKYIYQGRKTVVFDLDETLIHCNQNSNSPCDLKLTIKFPTGQNVTAGINVRPYAVEILKNLSKNFEIIVFTASHSCYANQVLDQLDPKKEYISHRLFRQHCYQTPEGVYIKDLRVINRQLSQLVLIDNAAYSFALQIENGIPILPFYQGKVDFQLKVLQEYIERLVFCKDVRDINRNTFKLNKYTQFEDSDSLVKSLYGDQI